MAALTKERLTDAFPGYPAKRTVDMKAATTIYKGSMVGIDSSGNAMPAGLTAGGTVRVVGVSNHTVVNSGAAAAKRVELSVGTFKFLNDGSDPVTKASVGTDCYVVDDQTVALTDGGAGARKVAGKVQQVESDGVRVFIG